MLKTIIFIIIFFGNSLFSKDFCEIKDIKKYDLNLLNCNESQQLFAYLKFTSRKGNFTYKKNNRYDVKIINDYYYQITNFINKFCSEKKKIRIKNITNFNKVKKNFNTKIILSCIYYKQ